MAVLHVRAGVPAGRGHHHADRRTRLPTRPTVDSYELGLQVLLRADNRLSFNLQPSTRWTSRTCSGRRLCRCRTVPSRPSSTTSTSMDDRRALELDRSAGQPNGRNYRLYVSAAYTDAEFKDFVTDDPLQFGTRARAVEGQHATADTRPGRATSAPTTPSRSATARTSTVGGEPVLRPTTVYFLDEFNRAPMEEDAIRPV